MGRILILEDEPGFQLILTEHLKDAGHLVTQAWDGAEALDLIQREPFDLLLLDNRMPGITGLEFLQRARQLGIEAPAIIMTAYAEIPVVVESMRLGALDFLPKPFRPVQSLLPMVERCLQRATAPDPAPT